jgi:hypothetical protein
MDVQIIIEEIKQLLTGFVIDAHAQHIIGDGPWTKEIKKRLAGMGNSYGYAASVGGFRDEHEPEWLFDLVWYKEEGKGENARLIEVPLVVESEWNLHFGHIKYDFEKLLVANAGLRLMICQARIENRDRIFNYCKDAVAKYNLSRSGDTYLIALLDTDTEKFYFDVIIK